MRGECPGAACTSVIAEGRGTTRRLFAYAPLEGMHVVLTDLFARGVLGEPLYRHNRVAFAAGYTDGRVAVAWQVVFEYMPDQGVLAVEVAEGPGRREEATGLITLAGEAERARVALSCFAARGMAAQALAYLRVWEEHAFGQVMGEAVVVGARERWVKDRDDDPAEVLRESERAETEARFLEAAVEARAAASRASWGGMAAGSVRSCAGSAL